MNNTNVIWKYDTLKVTRDIKKTLNIYGKQGYECYAIDFADNVFLTLYFKKIIIGEEYDYVKELRSTTERINNKITEIKKAFKIE